MTVGEDLFVPLVRFLGRLDGISRALNAAVRRIRDRRSVGEAADAAPASGDVDRAWELLGRTVRWWRVLLMRFGADLDVEHAALRAAFAAEMGAGAPPGAKGAEPDAPKPGRAEPGAPDPGRAAGSPLANLAAAMALLNSGGAGAGPALGPRRARPASRGRGGARPRGPRAPDPDSAIKRKSVAEIFDQICADLGAAATLLGETAAAREVAAIAAEARALLDGAGSAAGSKPPPGPGVRPARGAGPAPFSAAAAPVRAPDSG